MKKYVSVTLSVLLTASLLFAGCGTGSGTASSGSTSAAGSSASAESVAGESTGSIGSEAGSNAVAASSTGTGSSEAAKSSAASTAPAAPASSAAVAKTADGAKGGKVLVVYWSLTGNTNKLANMIKDMTGGDIFEIQPDFDYKNVKSRTEMENLGKKQVDEGFKPELKTKVDNIEQYDLIFVGSPVWWYSVTPAVMSFLTKENLKGKKVVPFCTCGSVYGEFFNHFKSAIPDSKYIQGISVTDSELGNQAALKDKIGKWLEQVNAEAAK